MVNCAGIQSVLIKRCFDAGVLLFPSATAFWGQGESKVS